MSRSEGADGATAAASGHEARLVDHRRLMKKVEQLVRDLGGTDGAETGGTIHALADRIIERFADELGFSGGRLYRRQGDSYVLTATFPDAKPIEGELRVPVTYPPVEALLSEGVVYMDRADPRRDPDLENRLGVQEFAAIETGDEEFLVAFDVARGHDREDVLFSLGVLRHAINLRLRQERMREVFDEARKIQASILPRRVPAYGEFDLWGASKPMESVGGDFYDFIPITDKILGLAIADVSGHGLPAALQVRDVYMGLRMGMARDFKIVRTVERLNAIIHKSTLTSRFVSMFYGELEPNGVFIYVNAGHPPPFHITAAGEVRFLEEGGPVLGPLAQASYERGFVRMAPGDVVVLYTDGMIESRDGAVESGGEEYGVDRLIASTLRRRIEPARAIVEGLFADLAAFTGDAEPEDDRTAVAVTFPRRDSPQSLTNPAQVVARTLG